MLKFLIHGSKRKSFQTGTISIEVVAASLLRAHGPVEARKVQVVVGPTTGKKQQEQTEAERASATL
jgi:hypothetical protein